MYKIPVRPVLTYASETWTWSKTDKRLLSLHERKVLRCISGAVQKNGLWRKRYNHKLHELFNDLDIVKYTKLNCSVVICMHHMLSPPHSVKKVFNTSPEGTKKTGRPKLRWEDGVTQDIKVLVKNLKSLAFNREGLLKFLKKARAHIGLSCQ
jgi:hypothetical protein